MARSNPRAWSPVAGANGRRRRRHRGAAVLLLLLAVPATAARRPAQPVVEDVDILELSPQMARFLVRHVSPKQDPEARVYNLMDAILGHKKLGVIYEGTGTGTAIETFEKRRGNCLSFTILFVAMARHLGLDAYFQEVSEVISWDRRGEMVVRNQHMIVEVEVKNGRQVVDFLPGAEKRYRSVRRITDERALAHFYNNLGVDILAEGDAALALAYFDRALAADQTFTYAWTNRGVAHRRLGDFEAAESGHLKALEIDKNEPAAMANLASLYLGAGLEEQAQPLLRQVENHLRRNPYHHFRQGASAARAGDLSAAIAHFKEAIRRMPEEPEFHAALADVLARSGDAKKARESLGKALELTEDEEERQRLRREFAAIEGGA